MRCCRVKGSFENLVESDLRSFFQEISCPIEFRLDAAQHCVCRQIATNGECLLDRYWPKRVVEEYMVQWQDTPSVSLVLESTLRWRSGRSRALRTLTASSRKTVYTCILAFFSRIANCPISYKESAPTHHHNAESRPLTETALLPPSTVCRSAIGKYWRTVKVHTGQERRARMPTRMHLASDMAA